MKAVAYALLAASAAGCVAITFALAPTSAMAGGLLAAWLALPYLGLALGLRFAREKRQRLAYLLVVLLVAGGGFLFLIDTVFLRPDAQGGIAVMFTPIYQAIAIGVLLPLAMTLAGRRSRA